jgi:hypothetical protein
LGRQRCTAGGNRNRCGGGVDSGQRFKKRSAFVKIDALNAFEGLGQRAAWQVQIRVQIQTFVSFLLDNGFMFERLE